MEWRENQEREERKTRPKGGMTTGRKSGDVGETEQGKRVDKKV